MSVQLKIRVTKQMLEKSKKCQRKSDSCAFACALRDILPEARVHHYVILPFCPKDLKNGEEVGTDELVQRELGFPTTPEMLSFINKFDKSTSREILQFPEQEFTLEIPDWVIEQINIEELRPLLINHPTLELLTQ